MLKRAVKIGFVVFLFSLIINAIAARILRVDIKNVSPNNLPTAMWFFGIIGAVISSIFGSLWFFSSRKIQARVGNGLMFGVVVSILGFILDIAALAPLKNGATLLAVYYTRIEYWTAFILIIMTSSLIGYIKSKKSDLIFNIRVFTFLYLLAEQDGTSLERIYLVLILKKM